MKTNVAKMVFAGVDNKELVNVLSQYLTEKELEALVYHFSGDELLQFEKPNVDCADLVAKFKKDHNRIKYDWVEVENTEWDIHDQLLSVRFKYAFTKWGRNDSDHRYECVDAQDDAHPVARQFVESTKDVYTLGEVVTSLS